MLSIGLDLPYRKAKGANCLYRRSKGPSSPCGPVGASFSIPAVAIDKLRSQIVSLDELRSQGIRIESQAASLDEQKNQAVYLDELLHKLVSLGDLRSQGVY